jgi:hypothetical protein
MNTDIGRFSASETKMLKARGNFLPVVRANAYQPAHLSTSPGCSAGQMLAQ